MAIEFVCPGCKSGLRVGDDAAGKVVRCGHCLNTVRAPAADEAAAESVGSSAGPVRRPVEPVAPPGSQGRPRARPSRRRPPPRPKGRGAGFWILIVFLILGALGVATCAGMIYMFEPKWRTHESAKGGFKVELPAAPRNDMRELAKMNNTPEFDIEGTVLLLKGEEFGIMYGPIDPATRRQFTDDQIIAQVITGMKDDDPSLQVIRESPVTVSGFTGKEVVLSHPTEGTGVFRVIVADDRLYVVFAGTRSHGADGNPDVRRFLDSFQITDQTLLARAADRKRERDRLAAAKKQEDDEEARAAEEEKKTEERERAEKLRRRVKTAGEDAADIVWDIALTAHADAVAAFQQANRGFRDGGRAAAGVAVLVAERERTSAINQPDLPIAPPPRLKGKPGP